MYYSKFSGPGERNRLATLGDVDAREREAVATAKARRYGRVQGQQGGTNFMTTTTHPVPVYVPTEGLGIVPGSGIVGEPVGADLVRIYYEGDVYGAGMTYTDKLLHAAGRMLQHYPVATQVVRAAMLTQVGDYDPATNTVEITDYDALDAWTGVNA